MPLCLGGEMAKGCIHDSVLELIGRTPLVRLRRLVEPGMAEVACKLEMYTPGGSVKDRIALSMIEDAERRGLLRPGATIIEPTSGNTGIGLAVVAAVKGYRLLVVMPESMSLERRFIIRSLGAELVLTPAAEGMLGARREAERLLASTPGAFLPDQFENPANPAAHREHTAREILADTAGRLEAFVAGVGTAGTITGVGSVLKQELPACLVVAVEPAASPVISGGQPAPHRIQGIGANFLPPLLDRAVVDQVRPVSDADSFATARRLAREEGIFVGVSAGAACWVALQVARELGAGKRVVVLLPDTGERYASLEQFFPQES